MKNERTPKDEGVLSFVVSIQTFFNIIRRD